MKCKCKCKDGKKGRKSRTYIVPDEKRRYEQERKWKEQEREKERKYYS